jgi:hypothetical protein
LRHDRQNVGDGEGKAELDKADTKLLLQKGKKRRQDQIVKVIDEMGSETTAMAGYSLPLSLRFSARLSPLAPVTAAASVIISALILRDNR